MKRLLTIAFASMFGLFAAEQAWSLGTEDFGNKPLSDANYDAWAGVMPIINDSHRVYHWWVNGNEKFFFKGETKDLNTALINFSKIKGQKLEVVLRPGPGVSKTFRRADIAYDWELHLIGGIAAGMRREDQGDLIWVSHPVLTIRVGDGIELSKLKIPRGVTVLQIGDLQARYAKAMETSTSKTVRGSACGQIAALDAYNGAAMYRIAKMLNDQDDWVRLNAAGAITIYGAKAKNALKQLRAAAKSEDERLSNRALESIEKIEAAQEDPEAEQRHIAGVKAIESFCEKLQTGTSNGL